MGNPESDKSTKSIVAKMSIQKSVHRYPDTLSNGDGEREGGGVDGVGGTQI